MRKTALAGLFVCAFIIAANGSTASAQALELLETNDYQPQTEQFAVLTAYVKGEDKVADSEVSKPEKEHHVHEVQKGESLSKIATLHQTTWRRLYDKNTQIEHPDIIAVGEKVTIPFDDETLAEREIPQPVAPVVAPVRRQAPSRRSQATSSRQSASAPAKTPVRAKVARGSSSGNLYAPGYCTWYVKNRRPDLPNNLGNADTWVARARAQGLPTGSTPRVGAVGQQGMHVVYVESVNGDGTVTISEMNFKGLYVTGTRTVPASNFQYIY